MPRQRLHDEQGFSLIELLIAVMVSGVILTALATGFIVTMKGTKGAHERLVESHDAQLLAAYFPSDVQSADESLVDLATWTADTTPADCAGPPASGSDNMLLLRWTELINGSSLSGFSVSYRLESGVAGEAKLVRYYCTGTAPITAPLPLSAAQRSAALQAALATVTATSDVVAHDLSPSQAPPTISGRKVSWSLMTSPKPPEVVPAQYTFELSASMRKLGTVAAAPPAGSYVVAMPASITAGSPFNVTVTLTGFTGTKNLTWSGPGTAPNGTAGASYPANPVAFNNGQATVSITLAKAETTTLTVTDGTSTGQSTAFTVNGGAPVSLVFTNCSANGGAAGSCSPNVAVGGNNKYMDGFVSVLDTYGNAAGVGASAWTIGVTSNDGDFVVSNSPVTVTGPATQSATTFHVEHTSNGNGSATLTATSAPVLSPASMTVSKS
jgi:prepilin-type N-terminal cleavage/methylation domain-containing protein